MKSYRGIVFITCRKRTCKKIKGQDVTPGCLNCRDANISILDLEGNVLAERGSPTENKEADNGISDSRQGLPG